MKEKKKIITDNQERGLKVLRVFNKSICCQDLLDNHKQLVKEQEFDIEKSNALNATLASLVNKELATKEKKQYKDKILTHYAITEKGLALISEEENK